MIDTVAGRSFRSADSPAGRCDRRTGAAASCNGVGRERAQGWYAADTRFACRTGELQRAMENSLHRDVIDQPRCSRARTGASRFVAGQPAGAALHHAGGGAMGAAAGAALADVAGRGVNARGGTQPPTSTKLVSAQSSSIQSVFNKRHASSRWVNHSATFCRRA